MSSSMSRILPLSVLSRLVTIQALLDLCNFPSTTAHYLWALLQTDHYSAFTETILKQVVEQFPSRMTGDLLKILSPPHMKELCIRKCWAVNVNALADVLMRCRKVQLLDLSECDHLMKPPLFRVLQQVASQLTCFTAENCELVNDKVVRSLLSNNPHLRQLNISMCENVTDEAFLLDEKLQLSRETNIKVHGYDRRGYPCHLTHVDLSGCGSLTSSGIRFLTTLCGPTLQHVNISFTEVDSTALWYLSGYGLTSAVHMAIAYIMEVNQGESGNEKMSELVKYMNEVSLGVDDLSDYEDDDLSDEDDEENDEIDEEYDENCHGDVRQIETENVLKPEVNITENSELESAVNNETNVIKITSICDDNKEEVLNTVSLVSSKEICDNNSVNEQTDSVDSIGPCYKEQLIPIYNVSFSTNQANNCNLICHRESLPHIEINLCPTIDTNAGKAPKPSLTRSSIGSDALSENLASSQSCDHKEPIRLQRVGYGGDRGSESGSSYQMSFSRKASDVSSCLSNDDDDDDVFECSTPVLDTDNPVRKDESLPCSSDKKNQNENSINISEDIGNNGSSHGNQKEADDMSDDSFEDVTKACCRSPLTGEKLMMATLATNALVAGCSVWKDALNDVLDQSSSKTDNDKPFPSTVKHSMKPDSSVEYCNDTLTLPPPQSNPEQLREKIKQIKKQKKQKKQRQFNELMQIYDPNIQVLDISHIAYNSKELVHLCMKAFFRRNKHVYKLNIAWKYLTDDILGFIADHTPELKTLSLVECDSLTNSGIAYLCSRCPNITRLNLQGVCFISDSSIEGLISNGNITSLNMAETNITDLSLARLAEQSGTQLRELDLSWCEELFEEQYEKSPGLDAVVTHCTGLQSLLVRHLPASPDTLSLIAENLINLHTLNLSTVNSLTDNHLVTIAVRYKCLKKLDVSWNLAVTDIGVSAILSNSVHLQELCVAGIKLLTSAPILPIIGDLAKWRRCQTLLRLKLHEQKTLSEQDHYSSDEEFEDLVLPHRSLSYSPCLRWLDAEYCDKVSDSHLAEIVAVCRGTLRARDYYGQIVTPAWVTCRKGKVFFAPTV